MRAWLLALGLAVVGQSALAADRHFAWPGGAKAAVSLAYDDAIHSQLDNAIPALDKVGLKGSFYLTLSSETLVTRLAEWRKAAANGHELGNHTLFHQCSRKAPGHEWVKVENDLDQTSVAQIAGQIRVGNSMLHAIDGKTERTFTVPCGDVLANGVDYLPAVKSEFVAIKSGEGGVVADMGTLDPYAVGVRAPEGLTGKQLIEMVKEAAAKGTMINFTFHGIGGDYITVSSQAHAELLDYLAANRDIYWTDTFMNIMKYVKSTRPEANTSAGYIPSPTDRVISRKKYLDQLQGFWLGECIANWTGLVTEMDKIGNIGEIKTGAFYTRDDWGKPDQQNIWGGGLNGGLSPTIDFIFQDEGGVWGSDDDTDIEYIYQDLLYSRQTSILTGEQIREGWLAHIKPGEENYLWVSNQKAFDLMKSGMVPPATGDPVNNPEFDMIDAQLTTEIFGLFAPARPDIALKMAELPIQTTARGDAQWISEFYVIMYSLASAADQGSSMKDRTSWMAAQARSHLPGDSTPAKMYDFVRGRYLAGVPWEQARDEVYERYQVNQADGYDMTSRKRYCNGCFAAGINFASSIISLLYGEGDLKETIKIGALAGWDSDNPTATWGGLLGFMIGKQGVEKAFDRKFADNFNIHRTRIGFPDNGLDNFERMAARGVAIVDRVVREEMGGGVDLKQDVWYVPRAR